jgi:hypothetical protein
VGVGVGDLVGRLLAELLTVLGLGLGGGATVFVGCFALGVTLGEEDGLTLAVSCGGADV